VSADPTLPFDVESLVQALADGAPSGPDLNYDPRFGALEIAGAGKPERQYGDKVYPAEPPLWPAVHEQALALAAETRDLRVAMWLLRSATNLHGLAGATAGLQLLAGLLERHWDSVHPQLDAADGNDPIMRINALMPLVAPEAFTTDLRQAGLAPVRGSMRLRELELGLGHDDPLPDEPHPSEAGVRQGLAALLAAHPAIGPQASAALAAVQAVTKTLHDKVGALHAADPALATRLLTALHGAVGGPVSDPPMSPGAPPTQPGTARSAPGEIASRADAAAALERVCRWFEDHEPAHPAPLLLRRAQRLLDKSFMEIMRDIAPDGLGQVENLAGPQG
jgi:type VI secretion system protein ImpA